jgi:broad specificity phosphatase PhoE
MVHFRLFVAVSVTDTSVAISRKRNVSHQDPIKAVVTYYAGIHIDMFSRFDISNASVTVIRVNDRDASMITLNNVGVLPM